MMRLLSRKDCQGYTLMRQVLINLELDKRDYQWLITDIEAYPMNEDIYNLINDKQYVILSTNELMDILFKEDFQWIWALFSAIPSKYSKEEIINYDLPHIIPTGPESIPFGDSPKIQHPLADIEIGAWDSSGMFIITDDCKLLEKFKEFYPFSI